MNKILKLLIAVTKYVIGVWLLVYSLAASADPNCTNLGNLFYVGTNGTSSFWLTISKARIEDAQLQGPNAQVVDNFTMFPNQLHLSTSPFLGTGPNGQHTLYNIKNSGPCFIDSAEQTASPPELPELPEGPGEGPEEGPDEMSEESLAEDDIVLTSEGEPINSSSGGFNSSSGSNVLKQLLLNVNKNFLTTYLFRTISVSDRVDNSFSRCEQEIIDQRWQVWAEPRYAGLNSRVATGDPNINSRNMHVGVSYNFNKNFLMGVSAVGNKSQLNAFDGSIINKTHGVIAGPYFGLKLNDVLLDTWIIYGHNNINSNLVGLKSNFDMHSLIIAGNGSVLFNICDNILQPKLSVFYSHNKTNSFNYTGIIPNRNTNVSLRVAKSYFYYGHASFTSKLFREICLRHGTIIPSLTVGVNNNYTLPDHGRILNRARLVTSVSKWSGIAKAGIGAKFGDALRLDFLTGYYSIGVKEDIWDLGLTVTLSI